MRAHARAALLEMHRQVGSDLRMEDGLVKRGLIIRHLVLPNDIAGSRESLELDPPDTLGPETTLSVMAQYFPTHKALTTPLLDRKIRESEYDKVLSLLEQFGMESGWAQEFEASEYYKPEFEDRSRPFKGGADNLD